MMKLNNIPLVILSFLILVMYPIFVDAQGVRPEQADKPFIVVIDPGHGGFDPGARGRYSSEKEIALGVSLKTGKLISTIPGVKVVYTRTTDIVPGNKTSKREGLHYRADFANQQKGNVFISVHCNSARNRSAKGTEVYVWGLGKNDDKGIALRENAPLKDDPEFQALNDEASGSALDAIFWNSVRRSYMQQSLDLAANVETQFAKINRIDRTVKQRKVGIWVLHATAMPSILVETGFISNPEEEDYLNNNQDEIATSIFKAFIDYLAGLKGITQKELLTGKKADDHTDPSTPSSQSSPSTPLLSGYHYKIQLFASSKKLSPHANKLRNLGDKVEIKKIDQNQNKKLYRYLLGNYKTYQEATKQLSRVKPLGYKEAFIVTYKDNKRLDL